VSANPRARNLVEQSANATAAARLPAIPPGASQFERAVKENLDVRNGVTGNPFEKWATERRLADLGLTGGTARGDMPSDQGGIPTWTARGKFELLTLLGLANALATFLPDGKGEIGRDEFQSLKNTVQRLQGGLSATEVAALLQRAESNLQQRFNAAIAKAGEAERGLVEELQETMTGMYSELRRLGRGYVHTQSSAAAVWTVAHGLAKRPLVTVIDGSGDQVFADVNYPDTDTVVITHGTAMTGTALLQ
jgi:hypothetical protein